MCVNVSVSVCACACVCICVCVCEREREREREDWLSEPPLPSTAFNDEPIANEISVVIKHTKSSSSPSPIDQVSYRVLKQCPSLLSQCCFSIGFVLLV